MTKGFYKKDGKTRPITERKREPNYSEQTEEASWKDSSIDDLKAEKLHESSSGKTLEKGAYGREADALIKSGALKKEDKEAYVSKRQREVDKNWKNLPKGDYDG